MSLPVAKLLVAGASGALFGVAGYRAYSGSSRPGSRRYAVPLRFESELEPLLVLPNPLLANFTILNDARSKELTAQLERLIEQPAEQPVSLVDIEVNEPGVAELLNRYMITSVPTVLALKGGIPVAKYAPDREVDAEELRKWFKSVVKK